MFFFNDFIPMEAKGPCPLLKPSEDKPGLRPITAICSTIPAIASEPQSGDDQRDHGISDKKRGSGIFHFGSEPRPGTSRGSGIFAEFVNCFESDEEEHEVKEIPRLRSAKYYPS